MFIANKPIASAIRVVLVDNFQDTNIRMWVALCIGGAFKIVTKGAYLGCSTNVTHKVDSFFELATATAVFNLDSVMW